MDAYNNAVWADRDAVAFSQQTNVLKYTVIVPEPVNGTSVFTLPLTLTVKDSNTNYVATATVNAKINVVNPATKITVTPTTLALKLDDNATATVQAVVEPANATTAVTWTVADGSVASVDTTGVVTAKKRGTTTVTAAAGELTATVNVTVTCGHSDTAAVAAKDPSCHTKNQPGNTAYTVCNDCGAVLGANGTETTLEAVKIPTVDCFGGTATCTAKAVCASCGNAYGEMKAHTYTVLQKDADNHWYKCADCDATNTKEAHKGGTATCTAKAVCTVCNTEYGNLLSHTYDQKVAADAYFAKAADCVNAAQYYKSCVCGQKGTETFLHGESLGHDFVTGTVYVKTETTHAKQCTRCDATAAAESHKGGTATCTAKAVCDVCGVTYGNLAAHNPAQTWEKNDTYHWKLCTTAGCTEELEKAEHAYQWVVDTPATETTEGLKHEACVCGMERSLNTVIPHIHTRDHVAAKAATCIAKGNIEYWTCESPLCEGKYYSDEACTTEVVGSVITDIDSTNHVNTVKQGAIEPSCFEAGKEGDTYCNDCKKTVATSTDIPATGNHVGGTTWYTSDEEHWKICTTEGCGAKTDVAKHDYQWVIDTPATELAEGVKHEECICGAERNANTVIPHTHKSNHTEAKAATCSAEGNIEYWTCESSLCEGKYYSDEACTTEVTGSVVIEKDPENHTYENGICKLCGAQKPGSGNIKDDDDKVVDTSKTGDTTNVEMYIGLLIISAAAITAILTIYKKRNVRRYHR